MSNQILAQFLLHIGDSQLILSHRLAEWCGHAPELELDIALANIGLDLLGQARTAKLKAWAVMKTNWLISAQSANTAICCCVNSRTAILARRLCANG